MNFFKRILAVCTVSALSVLSVGASFAADTSASGDKATVQTFYNYLSNPASKASMDAFSASISDGWESIGNYSGKNKTKEIFIGQVGGFSKLIPDLKWNIEEMLQDGNRVIVRSRATGTPNGPLFGVDGKGKGFEILTIDIHTVENGKITQTYHIEDWAGALGQLKGK